MDERKPYSSDLTDKQWQHLEPLLPAVKQGGRPARYSRREIVCPRGHYFVSTPFCISHATAVLGAIRPTTCRRGLWSTITSGAGSAMASGKLPTNTSSATCPRKWVETACPRGPFLIARASRPLKKGASWLQWRQAHQRAQASSDCRHARLGIGLPGDTRRYW